MPVNPNSPENGDRKGALPFLLLNACSEWAWVQVGGITPVARLLYHSTRAGITEILLLANGPANEGHLRQWIGMAGLRTAVVSSGDHDPFPERFPTNADVLYLDATFIIDPRLIAALITASETTTLLTDGRRQNRVNEPAPAMIVKTSDIPTWRQMGFGSIVPDSKKLFPTDIDPYLPHIRGTLEPYVMQIKNRASAQAATWALIRSQQKRVMDFPSTYLDPFFENWLTRLLCSTPVTPNMVTFFGAATALGAALLFWHGFFLLGALIMFPVEILDGVDGKLARTKLMFTKVGEYEDVIDYFYENTCYAALAVGLSNAYPSPEYLPAIIAVVLIISDTLDNVFYTVSEKWCGKSIDLMHRFDALFRLIAGRRNIYGVMFVIGFSLGYPLYTFALTAFWGFSTALIHGIRLFQETGGSPLFFGHFQEANGKQDRPAGGRR